MRTVDNRSTSRESFLTVKARLRTLESSDYNENLRKEAGHKGKFRYLKRKSIHEAKSGSIEMTPQNSRRERQEKPQNVPHAKLYAMKVCERRPGADRRTSTPARM